MNMVPNETQWGMSRLPKNRRQYLERRVSFEKIAQMIVDSASSIRGWIEDYETAPKKMRRVTFRGCFAVTVDLEAYDHLYNAPDGLRGRYWQSPDRGFLATRFLIDLLTPNLPQGNMQVSERVWKPNNAMDWQGRKLVSTSLKGVSAKVWVREVDDQGYDLIDTRSDEQLDVPNWAEVEADSPHKLGAWRWTPSLNVIEIKGGFIDLHGVEHIPDNKRDRSCQIHKFGFT